MIKENKMKRDRILALVFIGFFLFGSHLGSVLASLLLKGFIEMPSALSVGSVVVIFATLWLIIGTVFFDIVLLKKGWRYVATSIFNFKLDANDK